MTTYRQAVRGLCLTSDEIWTLYQLRGPERNKEKIELLEILYDRGDISQYKYETLRDECE